LQEEACSSSDPPPDSWSAREETRTAPTKAIQNFALRHLPHCTSLCLPGTALLSSHRSGTSLTINSFVSPVLSSPHPIYPSRGSSIFYLLGGAFINYSNIQNPLPLGSRNIHCAPYKCGICFLLPLCSGRNTGLRRPGGQAFFLPCWSCQLGRIP